MVGFGSLQRFVACLLTKAEEIPIGWFPIGDRSSTVHSEPRWRRQPVDPGARLLGRTRLRTGHLLTGILVRFAFWNVRLSQYLSCTFRVRSCKPLQDVLMLSLNQKKVFAHRSFQNRSFYRQTLLHTNQNDILCQLSTDLDVCHAKVFARWFKIARLPQNFNIFILHTGDDQDFTILTSKQFLPLNFITSCREECHDSPIDTKKLTLILQKFLKILWPINQKRNFRIKISIKTCDL